MKLGVVRESGMVQRNFNRRQFVRLGAMVAASMAFGMTACSSVQESVGSASSVAGNTSSEVARSEGQSEASASTAQEAVASRTLVVCWSQTGNTRPLAEYVADITGADFYEIEAVEPYLPEDLNYDDPSTRATVEQQQTLDVRPAIAGELPNMDNYDTVFIAHPIWWGKAPRIVLTFLESVDLSGKTVVEFVTSGSSGIEGAEGETHAAAPNANWLEGKRFDAGTSRETMEEWVQSLGLAGPKLVQGQETTESKVLLISSGDIRLEATLEDNVATAELVALLQEGSIEVSLHEYGGFEMIGGLPQSLPTADEQISTSTGDIVLYQGKQISFFYASNSWSYTRLGHIDGYNSAALLEALGGPYDSTIELSLKE